MRFYQRLLRPLLFSLPPERGHRVGEFFMSRGFLWRMLARRYRVDDPGLRTTLAGIELSNPVGVAAGCDKDCRFLPSLMSMGFGYVVGGTVTLNPRSGNPAPRLLRKVGDGALVNSLGFPGVGAGGARRNLERNPARPLILSVSGLEVEELVECYRRMAPLADGVEVNVSSPNTAGLRAFHQPETFRELLERLNAKRKGPLFVKIPPYDDDRGRDESLSLVRIARDMGVDGVTAANTRPVTEPALKMGRGGLSGRPLFPDTLRMVAEVRREVGDGMAVNACGGISTPGQALEALEAGADTVQVYTGLIFEGPGVARDINRGLSRHLRERGLSSVAGLRRRGPSPG